MDDTFDDVDFEMHSFHDFKDKIFAPDADEQLLPENGKLVEKHTSN